MSNPSVSAQNLFGDNLTWSWNLTNISEDALTFGVSFSEFLSILFKTIEYGGVPSRKYIDVFEKTAHIKSLANIQDEKL